MTLQYINLKDTSDEVTLREAVLRGLGRNRGLYFPRSLPTLPPGFLNERRSFLEIALESARALFGHDLPVAAIEKIVTKAFTFEAPLVQLDERLSVLELFHGPTFAFKDFGARFLAALLAHYAEDQGQEITVLVATSGDTGSAVAHSFAQKPGVSVVILYPSGRVSKLQEMQLTTAGPGVTALEVQGSFDDCQRMVKDAFASPELSARRTLTSANSINLARLLPQSFYYLHAAAHARHRQPLAVVVPSGNFGNLVAGVIAKRMGAPIAQLVAATNDNATVPDFLTSGVYTPRPSVSTISNAMDVGDPSNFPRLLALYNNDLQLLRKEICAHAVGEQETVRNMRETYNQYSYLADPHTSVGIAAWRRYHSFTDESYGVVAATAHPGKFFEVIRDTTGITAPLPEPLADCLRREKRSVILRPETAELIDFLSN